MVKDNTHILVADKVLKKIKSDRLRKMIYSNLDYYYVGSFAPDLFFYNFRTLRVARYLHGADGELTNKVIFYILKKAKKTKSEKDLAFLLGYLTHYTMDSIFHPIVYYFTGNPYCGDRRKAWNAEYFHNHLETYLDAKWNHKFYTYNYLKVGMLDDLYFTEFVSSLDIFKFNIKLSAFTHKIVSKLTRSSLCFRILYFLNKLKLFPKPVLSLFYANLKVEKKRFKNSFVYRDPISGKYEETSFDALLEKAIGLSLKRINVAYKYYIDEGKDFGKLMLGESFNTGKVGVGVKKVKYILEK